MSIYAILAKARDKVSHDQQPDVWNARAHVLGQLAGQAFANEEKNDEIPKSLYIQESQLDSKELLELFEELELEVETIVVRNWQKDRGTIDCQIGLGG